MVRRVLAEPGGLGSALRQLKSEVSLEGIAADKESSVLEGWSVISKVER